MDENIVAYVLFLKKKQEKLPKRKVPCANAAIVIQAISQMEVSNHFDSYNMIEWEEKEKAD